MRVKFAEYVAEVYGLEEFVRNYYRILGLRFLLDGDFFRSQEDRSEVMFEITDVEAELRELHSNWGGDESYGRSAAKVVAWWEGEHR